MNAKMFGCLLTDSQLSRRFLSYPQRRPGKLFERLKIIFEELGYPSTIISDGDILLNNTAKQDLLELGTSLEQTSKAHSYHNGMVERRFRTLKERLSAVCKDFPSMWERYLQDVVNEMNNINMLEVNKSPFEMAFGFRKRTPPSNITANEVTTQGVERWAERHNRLLETALNASTETSATPLNPGI